MRKRFLHLTCTDTIEKLIIEVPTSNPPVLHPPVRKGHIPKTYPTTMNGIPLGLYSLQIENCDGIITRYL